MEDAEIRPAARDELDAVWAVERDAFGAEAYPRLFFRQAFDLWPDLLRVAVLPGGRVAGYVVGAPSTQPEVAWILALAVAPVSRGRGVASALVEDVVRALARLGAREVRLTVHPDHPDAVGLYEKLGFRAVHEEPDYFGPGEPRRVLCRVPGP